jgi:hypothetical protein
VSDGRRIHKLVARTLESMQMSLSRQMMKLLTLCDGVSAVQLCLINCSQHCGPLWHIFIPHHSFRGSKNTTANLKILFLGYLTTLSVSRLYRVEWMNERGRRSWPIRGITSALPGGTEENP